VSGATVRQSFVEAGERAARTSATHTRPPTTSTAIQTDITAEKVPLPDIMHFSRQMATFLRAGVPVTEAIDNLRQDAKNKRFRAVLNDVLERVTAGRSLASSLGAHEDVFPPYYMAKASIMGVMQLLGKPSRSSMTLPSTLLAPIHPYRPRRGALWRHDPSSDRPIELPMCVIPGLRLPIIGTSLHLLGHRGFELVYPLLRAAYKRCLQLEFHAIDFMDAQDIKDEALIKRQPDLRVPWHQKRHLYAHVFSRLSEDYAFKTMTSVARTF